MRVNRGIAFGGEFAVHVIYELFDARMYLVHEVDFM